MNVGGMVPLETRKEKKMKARERMFKGVEISWKRMVGLAMAVTCVGLFLGGCDGRGVGMSTEAKYGKCRICYGSGEVDCPRADCILWEGVLDPLGGKHILPCPECHGVGTSTKFRTDTCWFEPCRKCNGNARKLCPTCGGANKIPCPKCHKRK